MSSWLNHRYRTQRQIIDTYRRAQSTVTVGQVHTITWMGHDNQGHPCLHMTCGPARPTGDRLTIGRWKVGRPYRTLRWFEGLLPAKGTLAITTGSSTLDRQRNGWNGHPEGNLTTAPTMLLVAAAWKDPDHPSVDMWAEGRLGPQTSRESLLGPVTGRHIGTAWIPDTATNITAYLTEEKSTQ